MPAINVANVDWCVISDVRDALADATIDGEDVFQAVTVTTSDAQARQCQFTSAPVAVIRYLTTREHTSPDAVVGCTLDLQLTLAAKVDSAAADESDRIQEVLRLVNAAKNAVNDSPPAAARAFGAGRELFRRVEWAAPEIDAVSSQPWAVCLLDLRIAFTIANETSH